MPFSLRENGASFTPSVYTLTENALASRVHTQPDRSHQLKRIACLYDSGLYSVVENQFAILETVLEMAIGGPCSHHAGNRRQREIVCAHDADCAVLGQGTQDEVCSLQAVVRVGSREQFVEQEKDLPRPFGEIADDFDPGDFRIETRDASRQRIENTD